MLSSRERAREVWLGIQRGEYVDAILGYAGVYKYFQWRWQRAYAKIFLDAYFRPECDESNLADINEYMAHHPKARILADFLAATEERDAYAETGILPDE